MKKAVLVTDMSSFTSSTESRGIIHVGAKIFALRELLLPLMRSYGAQARSATGKPADILLVHYCPCGIVHLSRNIPDITQKRPIPQEQNARRNLSTGFPVALPVLWLINICLLTVASR